MPGTESVTYVPSMYSAFGTEYIDPIPSEAGCCRILICESQTTTGVCKASCLLPFHYRVWHCTNRLQTSDHPPLQMYSLSWLSKDWLPMLDGAIWAVLSPCCFDMLVQTGLLNCPDLAKLSRLALLLNA